MRMSVVAFWVGILAACATLMVHSPSQTGEQDPEAGSVRRDTAVNLVRAINTAELNYKLRNGAYADWPALVRNGDFTSEGTKWAPKEFPTIEHLHFGPGPEILAGWRLRLNLTASRQTYDLMLEDELDEKCGYAAIADERGIIREGITIDCRAEARNSGGSDKK